MKYIVKEAEDNKRDTKDIAMFLTEKDAMSFCGLKNWLSRERAESGNFRFHYYFKQVS